MLSYVIDDDFKLALPRPRLDSAPLFAIIDQERDDIGQFLPLGEWIKNGGRGSSIFAERQ